MGLGDIALDKDGLDFSIFQQDTADIQKMLLQLRGVLIEEKLQNDVSFERMCEIEMELEVLSRKCIGLTMMSQGVFSVNWWTSFQCSTLYFSLVRAQKRVREREIELKTAQILEKVSKMVYANDRWYEDNDDIGIQFVVDVARQKAIVLKQLLDNQRITQ